MAVEIEPVDELALWNRPAAGQLALWVRWTIAVACVVTIGVVAASAHVVWRMDGPGTGLDRFGFRYGPPAVVLLAMAIAFVPSASTSRFIRLAVLLPVIHAVAMIVTWRVVTAFDLISLGQRTPLARDLPVFELTLAIAGSTVVMAWWIARRRREWIQALVTIALANLLLLGLWLPLAARWWAYPGIYQPWDAALAALGCPRLLVASTLVPPFLLACGYAASVIHAPRFARRSRAAIAVGLVVLFATAFGLRASGYYETYVLYDNFVHAVLATVFVAILATAGLAVATWRESLRAVRRLAHEPGRQLGVVQPVDDADDVIACLQITSWLRAPRLISRSFVAITERGELVVPGGAQVALGLPLVSSVLHTGEAVVVLRGGDRVELAGFVDRDDGDHPFRSATVPVPGPHGVMVGRASVVTAAVQVGLATWRPAVAYLVIVIVVAIPGLAGVLVH